MCLDGPADCPPAGTSFLIEDVACPVNRLADMTVDLGNMFQKHGYEDASCFGHALEGNLHLVFSQVWSSTCMLHAQFCWHIVGFRPQSCLTKTASASRE